MWVWVDFEELFQLHAEYLHHKHSSISTNGSKTKTVRLSNDLRASNPGNFFSSDHFFHYGNIDFCPKTLKRLSVISTYRYRFLHRRLPLHDFELNKLWMFHSKTPVPWSLFFNGWRMRRVGGWGNPAGLVRRLVSEKVRQFLGKVGLDKLYILPFSQRFFYNCHIIFYQLESLNSTSFTPRVQ